MTQKNEPGYPLPSGELGEDEIVCQLVYLPNRPEYWQALLAAIHYFSTWRAWERDEDKRGKDAATNWREAFELTMECWRMTCLDALLEELIAIRLLLSQQRDCCEIPFIYIDDDPVDPPEIDPGVGDPPDTWGEDEEIETWEDWEAYVCHYANVYVDNLLGMADSLTLYAQLGAFAIMAIAGLLALGASLGFIIAVAYPAAAGIVAGLVLGATTVTFLDTRDEIEAARDSIVCAIMQNTGLADAVEDALGSGLAWDLFFQFINYNQALEIIYTGEYDGEYLEPLTDDSCECADPNEFDITFEFDEDEEEWTNYGPGTRNWDGSHGDPAGSLHMRNNNQTSSGWNITGENLLTRLGGTGATEITLRELHFVHDADFAGAAAVRIAMCGVLVDTFGYSGFPIGSWIDYDKVRTEVLENMNETVVNLEHYGTGSGAVSCWYKYIRLVGRYD